MYQNIRWLTEVYESQHWAEVRDKIPVNPPGAFLAEGDVMIHDIDLLNWMNDNGDYEFHPRLRDRVQEVSRTRIRAITIDEAPEIDEEYDCD